MATPQAPTYTQEERDVMPSSKIPFNTTTVSPDKPVSDYAVDPMTGLMNYEALVNMRDRAIFDINALSYAPAADSGTGLIFPGAVRKKTELENEMRPRPTVFRGRQQLDVDDAEGTKHMKRYFHPLQYADGKRGTRWRVENVEPGTRPFIGYPNPDVFYGFDLRRTIPTHYIGDLSQDQLDAALGTNLAADQRGDAESHLNHLENLGRLVKGENVTAAGKLAPMDNSGKQMVMTQKGGVNDDPRKLRQYMEDTYERDFALSTRFRMGYITDDTRYLPHDPSIDLIAEKQAIDEARAERMLQLSSGAAGSTGSKVGTLPGQTVKY